MDSLPSHPRTVKESLDQAVRTLKKEGCTAVYVFGSAATGKMRDTSDIDLAVRGCPEGKFFRVLGRLLMELRWSVDLVDLDNPDPFAEHLQREGRLQRIG